MEQTYTIVRFEEDYAVCKASDPGAWQASASGRKSPGRSVWRLLAFAVLAADFDGRAATAKGKGGR